ncbi:hypothetical protein [Micromonospora sp. NPDC005652]|uniref:hypothetical protein n=1 Tax=Micromonospora sp. NPDC005652 TaxID=3157046 RepID=UPI003406F755
MARRYRGLGEVRQAHEEFGGEFFHPGKARYDQSIELHEGRFLLTYSNRDGDIWGIHEVLDSGEIRGRGAEPNERRGRERLREVIEHRA